MAGALWRGSWATRLRIASGLVLFTYAFFHFINIGLGLIESDLMDAMQDTRQLVSRHPAGTVLLYGSLLIHAGLALVSLAKRRSLRMPAGTALQAVLGLLIPLQLIAHIVQTRYANTVYGVKDEMGYLIILMWPSSAVWLQSGLLLVVWVHGCIGLHYWLRLTRWWQRAIPYLIGLAVFVPAFALAGLLTEGRRMYRIFMDDEQRPGYMEYFNWPSNETFAELFEVTNAVRLVFWILLALTAAVFLSRKIIRRRNSVQIRYVEGPEIQSERGMTLLEMSQSRGVPHAALCGGKGRCTTCRVVVEDGADLLHPPSETELRSLQAVNASANTRLACQIRPAHPTTVFRVFRPEGGRARSNQGQERQLAVLFLDMRGFTTRTAGQLPYDVVFLLNRYFNAIVPPITKSGGTVDKYLGDGLLAVFEAEDKQASAQAALKAANGIVEALDRFNTALEAEGTAPVRIGIGLHLGTLVLGEIGAVGHAQHTIIGDTVNVASRLESKTKELEALVLVSADLLEAAGKSKDAQKAEPVTLRGVDAPVPALAVREADELTRLATA